MGEENSINQPKKIEMNAMQKKHLIFFQRSIERWIQKPDAQTRIRKCYLALKRHEKNIILQMWDIEEKMLWQRLQERDFLLYFMNASTIEHATYSHFCELPFMEQEEYHVVAYTKNAKNFISDWDTLNHYRIPFLCKEDEYYHFSHPKVKELWDRLSKEDQKNLFCKWEVKNYEEAVALFER